MHYQHEMVAMRDGVKLGTHIWIPEGEGPWPVLILRHAYGDITDESELRRFAEPGYVVIRQDCRGRYTSEGNWDQPLDSDAEDGEDTLDWIAEQTWCNGKVGAIGASYGAITQMLLSTRQPNALTAQVPCAAGQHSDGLTFVDRGVYALSVLVGWVVNVSVASMQREGTLSGDPLIAEALRLFEEQLDTAKQMFVASGSAEADPAEAINRFYACAAKVNAAIQAILAEPLSNYIKGIETISPWTRDWVEHTDPDDVYWQCQSWSSQIAEKMDRPALVIAGWYDLFSKGTINDFAELLKQPDAKDKHRLIVLPFEHVKTCAPGLIPDMAEHQYPWKNLPDPMFWGGCSPSINRSNVVTDWLAHWMKGEDNDIMDMPPIQLYVMGENIMRGEQEWPLARTEWTNFYLHSGGQANTADGNGSLSTSAPGEESADQYIYDPANPVPSIGGQGMMMYPSGAWDQQPIEERDDVLVYSIPALEQDTEVTGPVVLNLWVATTAVDTDFTGKLVDVHPDGQAIHLCDGVTRLRYRKTRPGLVTPGEVQEVRIELRPTSNLFKKGHRIRVEVSSSNFPYFDPNPNTGKSLLLDESNEMVVVRQTVYHDVSRPSHLVLPVIPR